MVLAATKFNHQGAVQRKGYYDPDARLYIPAVVIEPAAGPLQSQSAGSITTLEASFQRPGDTTPYALNDLVAPNASQNAANAIPVSSAVFANGDAFRVERLRFRKTTNTTSLASFRIHIWRDLPTFAGIGDNGAQGAISALLVDDMQYHVDYIDVVVDRAASGATAGAYGIGVPIVGNSITVKPRTGLQFYYSVQALAAYVPGNAEQFFAVFEGMRA